MSNLNRARIHLGSCLRSGAVLCGITTGRTRKKQVSWESEGSVHDGTTTRTKRAAESFANFFVVVVVWRKLLPKSE